jgi:hypothetical protein
MVRLGEAEDLVVFLEASSHKAAIGDNLPVAPVILSHRARHPSELDRGAKRFVRGVGRMRYVGILGLVLLLPACSMSVTDFVSPLLEHHAEAPPPPEPVPPYRRLIADHMGELFAVNSEVSNVRISDVRKLDSSASAVWRVCLKAETKTSDGSTVARTYVVLIQRGQITDRRTASSSDKCDDEKYDRLGPG